MHLEQKGGKCKVFNSDLKVRSEEYNAFLYPDAFVICGEEQYYNDRKDIVTNPILIIEVLSESSAWYDQPEKFRKYRSIPSFKEYILIDQEQASIEGFYRETKDYWRIQSVRGLEDRLYLHSIDCTLALTDIYWQVVLEAIAEGN